MSPPRRLGWEGRHAGTDEFNGLPPPSWLERFWIPAARENPAPIARDYVRGVAVQESDLWTHQSPRHWAQELTSGAFGKYGSQRVLQVGVRDCIRLWLDVRQFEEQAFLSIMVVKGYSILLTPLWRHTSR